jgi:hypothetical protein
MCLFYHIVNTMLVNSYLLWNLQHDDSYSHGHHLKWRIQIAQDRTSAVDCATLRRISDCLLIQITQKGTIQF